VARWLAGASLTASLRPSGARATWPPTQVIRRSFWVAEASLGFGGVVRPTGYLTTGALSLGCRSDGSGFVSLPQAFPRRLASRGGQRPRRQLQKTRPPCPPACAPLPAVEECPGPRGIHSHRPGGRARSPENASTSSVAIRHRRRRRPGGR